MRVNNLLVPSNSPFPYVLHVLSVNDTKLLIIDTTKRSLEFKKSKGAKCGKGGIERNRIESVQYRWRTSVLQHPVRSDQFTERPSNYGKHSKTCMSDFSFLHSIQIIFFREAQGIKSIVPSMASIQGRRAFDEWNGNRVFPIVVSTTEEIWA